jgi:hypothetical protein
MAWTTCSRSALSENGRVVAEERHGMRESALSARERFVAYKVALGQGLFFNIQSTPFFLSQYNSTSAPYPSLSIFCSYPKDKRTSLGTFHNHRSFGDLRAIGRKVLFTLQARSSTCEKRLLASSCLSVRPPDRMEQLSSHQWRTEGGGFGGVQPPPPKFRGLAKAEPNSQFRGIYIRNNLIRIWVSLICKLSGTPD